MRIIDKGSHKKIFLGDEEAMRLCRPGQGADTCIRLVMGVEGWECVYHDRSGVSLTGKTLDEQLKEGTTVAKRDGCDVVKQLKSVLSRRFN